MRRHIRRWGLLVALLDRWQPSESMVMGGLALLVGLTGGAGIWLFKELIDLSHLIAYERVAVWLAPLGSWTAILIPVLGGLVVGLIIHFWIGQERHHGVAGIIESVALAGGRLRYWRVPAKALASAISIGSGASVGPEDPSVQIGANLGSMFGQWVRLSDERVRALVAAGAAAGVAAAFNAPIAGVFFALELILGEISGNALGVVVLAAVVSSVFTQAVAGPQPAFRVPAYPLNSAWELPFYLGLGLLAGLVAAAYIRLMYLVHDVFHHWAVPAWLKPIAAGLIVGVVGLFLPQALGIGYSTIDAVLGGEQLTIGLLLALLAAKLLLTPVSIGGGFVGGVFAPALFLGCVLGEAFGQVVTRLAPGLNVAPAAFAMVGMAAVLAGAVHSPLTAILLLFEMTHDYRIILPLMFAVVVSLLVSQRRQRDSVYTLGLARRGVRIQRGRDVEVLDALTVGEVMEQQFQVVHETDSLDEATQRFLELRSHGLPVVNAIGDLVGMLTVQDIDMGQANKLKTVGQACTRQLLVAYPDETLGQALRRMGVRDIGRLPVVARNNPRELLGVLRRVTLVRAYDAALTRRATLRHRAQEVRLGAVSGAQVEEFTVQPGAPCANRKLSESAWPPDCIIATIRRGRHLLIPHGDTLLQEGDVLTVVTEGEAAATVRELCGHVTD